MGLLEKALEYKKEMNSRGRETIMDRIKGPAETEFMSVEDNAPDEVRETSGDDVLFLNENDLTEIVEESRAVESDEPASEMEVPEQMDVPVVDELDDKKDDGNIMETGSSLESDLIDISFLEETAIDETDDLMKASSGMEIEDEMFMLPDEDDESAETGRSDFKLDEKRIIRT